MGEFNCPEIDPEGDTDDFIPIYRGTPHPVTPREVIFEPAVSYRPASEPEPENPSPAPTIPWANLAAILGLAGIVRWLGHRGRTDRPE
jgi:hypothetical protein